MSILSLQPAARVITSGHVRTLPPTGGPGRWGVPARLPGLPAGDVARPSVRSRQLLLPWAIAVLVTAVHGIVALRIHRRLGTGMDLAIFDQAVRSLSHFQAPTAAMKSVGMNLWGDHFHPLIVVWAPLYWIWDDPRMLLLGQAACVGLACAVVCRTALRLVPGSARWAAAVVLPLWLAASVGVQFAMGFDVHEVALGAPVLALALAALLEGRRRAFLGCALLLLLVKEDAGILVAGLAAVVFLRGARRLGVALAAVAVGWTVLVLKVVIPAFSPTGAWLYSGAVQGVRTSLWHLVAAFTLPGALGRTVVVLLLTTGFLALRSPLVLALVPVLLSRAISGNPAYWGLAFHYNLLPCVLLAFATLDVLRRLREPRRALVLLATVAAVLTFVGPSRNQARGQSDPVRVAAAQAAIRVVPAGADVAADVYLVSHLTKDHPVTQQLRPATTPSGTLYPDDLGHPIADEWLVLDRHTVSQGGPAWVQPAIDHFTAAGYRIVHDEGGFVVLHRPEQAR